MIERVPLHVLRYLPERAPEPRWETFAVPRHEAWSLLDALSFVKEELDPSLSWRWSCRMGVCGSCGMMVNGTPRLACETFLREHPRGLRVEPLQFFPIVRDLVIDDDPFLKALPRARPWLIAREPSAPEEIVQGGVVRQRPHELARYVDHARCINCLLCYAACPQFGLTPDFIGPAVIALARRYNEDSRDAGRAEREPTLNAEDGVWRCTLVGACSEVCPTGVDPAAAIQREKVAGAWAYLRGAAPSPDRQVPGERGEGEP